MKLIKLLGHCAVHTTKAQQCVTNLYKTINVVTFVSCKKIMLHIHSLDNESLHVPPTDLDSLRWMITQRAQEIWLFVLGLHVCIFTSYLNFVDDDVETCTFATPKHGDIIICNRSRQENNGRAMRQLASITDKRIYKLLRNINRQNICIVVPPGGGILHVPVSV